MLLEEDLATPRRDRKHQKSARASKPQVNDELHKSLSKRHPRACTSEENLDIFNLQTAHLKSSPGSATANIQPHQPCY